MKKRLLILALAAVLCVVFTAPALAANVFLFTEKTITLREGETYESALRREGVYAGEGEITYSSGKPSIAAVSGDGVITAVSKGQVTVTASLNRNGKRVGRAQITVKVIRPVTKVTLSTEGLKVYQPQDEAVSELLTLAAEHPVIVISAGGTAALNATCTPTDASDKNITYTTTDAGVAQMIGKRTLKGLQRGECELIVASAQDPEVTETWHVLVIQPVKKIEIRAGDKKVPVGGTLQLSAVCSPEDASIPAVTWSSRNPAIASVDENGLVTGVKKGQVIIQATAADGSRVVGNVSLNVTQPVTGLTFSQAEIPVIAGRTAAAKVTVSPASASDKSLTWFSSDEGIATVKGGRITGVKAGRCTVTCVSVSNPEVTASVSVVVSQLVTGIQCATPADQLSLLVGETVQLDWTVLPADATNPELSFRSAHARIASVDANGIVRALSRGTATIVATAQDGSRKQGIAKINVIQPVTGVTVQNGLYYVQRGSSANIRAVVEPRNANNQLVYWSIDDESIATVRSSGTSTGSVTGLRNGTATVTCVTDDGGYTASAQIKVGNYNSAVMVEDLQVYDDNDIRIVLRNMTDDITMSSVRFRVECFDISGEPMICNEDGESTYFDGTYPFELYPMDRTVHGYFRFEDDMLTEPLGGLIFTVLSWRDTDGYTWTIPESEQIHRQWARFMQ